MQIKKDPNKEACLLQKPKIAHNTSVEDQHSQKYLPQKCYQLQRSGRQSQWYHGCVLQLRAILPGVIL